jgi:hypothetical protein
MVLPTQGIRTVGHKKVHMRQRHVIFSEDLHLKCGVIERHLAVPYYRNFLEKELPLCTEDVHLAAQGQMWIQHN